jgi:hypothetical protein
MAATWTNIFASAPSADGDYWIVRLPYFDTPTIAHYTLGDTFFQWNDSNGNTNNLEFHFIFKWRDV